MLKKTAKPHISNFKNEKKIKLMRIRYSIIWKKKNKNQGTFLEVKKMYLQSLQFRIFSKQEQHSIIPFSNSFMK